MHESLSELDVTRHVKERIETVKRETGSDLTKMLPIYMMDSDEDLIRNFPFGYAELPLYSRHICEMFKAQISTLKQVSKSLFTFDLTRLTGVEDISIGEIIINKITGHEEFKIKKFLTENDKRLRQEIFAMLNSDDPAKELLEVKRIENPKHPCYDECGLFAKCDIEADTLFFPYSGLFLKDTDANAFGYDNSTHDVGMTYAWNHKSKVVCDGFFARNMLAYANHPINESEEADLEVLSYVLLKSLPIILYRTKTKITAGKELFVSYGEEYFEGLRSNCQMYEAKVQKYKEACKQREQSQTEKQQVERTLSSMMEAINLRTEVEDDVSKNLKYVKEMYLKKYKQLDEVNMKLTRDKEILQLTTHKLAYSNGELERHKRKLRDQLEEKAKLAKLLEERNRSLEREQRKAKKAMQELVINFGHLAYEMNEKKKMEQKEKLKNGWKKETKRIDCVYGLVWAGSPCHVCEGKMGAHWDKPCSYRKQMLQSYGIKPWEDERKYNTAKTPKPGRSKDHVWPILQCKYNRLHRWSRASGLTLEAHYVHCPSNTMNQEQDEKNHNDILLKQAEHDADNPKAPSDREHFNSLELKKIIVCVLFVNGANKYFQTKSFCNEPTLEEHHLAREKLVIADTDISVMIGFIKRLNLDEEYLSSHDKEMLALGYESKYIENGDDMRLKDRVSFIPLDL